MYRIQTSGFFLRRRVHHESSVYVTTSSSWSRSILFCKIYLLTLVGYAVIDPRVEQQRVYLGTKIVSASFMPWHEFRGTRTILPLQLLSLFGVLDRWQSRQLTFVCAEL